MTKNAAINLAVKILKRWAVEYYGWDANHKPEAKKKWDDIVEAITILESLKEAK